MKKRKVTCEVSNSNEKCDTEAVPMSWTYCNDGPCSKTTSPPQTTFQPSFHPGENHVREELQKQKWTVGDWSKVKS